MLQVVAGWLESFPHPGPPPTICSILSFRSSCALCLREGLSHASRLTRSFCAPVSGAPSRFSLQVCLPPWIQAYWLPCSLSPLMGWVKTMSLLRVWLFSLKFGTMLTLAIPGQKPKHSHRVTPICGSSPFAQALHHSGSGTLNFPTFPNYFSGSWHHSCSWWRGFTSLCCSRPFLINF